MTDTAPSDSATPPEAPFEPKAPAVLAVDVGGSHVKLLVNGARERRRFVSGKKFTAAQMVEGVLEHALDLEYTVVSVGIPAPVVDGRVAQEPMNLGKGWVGFDYEAAFGKPTKVVNDAAMQALGGYTGGRMLFLGLGTGLGSTMVVDGILAAALEPEYVVLGGGNAKRIGELPANCRLGANQDAFLGGFRLWVDG